MSFFENIILNSKINFYLILTIFFIILFYPLNSKTKINQDNSYTKAHISKNLKQFTEYAILN